MKKKKILIVDDEEYLHKIYGRFLCNDFDILHAYDGAEALVIAADQKPDIILLDIIMPILDGRTLCQKLKKSPNTKDIKIIMLTGKKTEQHDVLTGYEVGADDYITKPCTKNYLKMRLTNVLREHP